MIDQDTLPLLAPIACAWARAQEELILRIGAPLGQRQLEDARRAGVQNPSRVRMLVVDRIPLPENAELADAAARAQIITTASRAMAIGHGVVIRADSWQDRELIVHQFVHVAQCERAGSLDAYVQEYLRNRREASFGAGSLEDEARRLASEICAAASLAK